MKNDFVDPYGCKLKKALKKVQKLEEENALAKEKLTELEQTKQQLAECEARPQCNPDPVYSIGNTLVFNGVDCETGNTATTLGGDTITNVNS